MLQFDFCTSTRILFGKDMENDVGKYVAEYSRNILLHYGAKSAEKSGLLSRVRKSLEKNGISYSELGGVQPNPRAALVYKGIELCRQKGIDFILAVGGGSVIDSAKAIGIGVPYEGDFYDFYSLKASPAKTLKVATVLTMPGAGSESSNGSVITNEEKGTKTSCDVDLMRPVFSVLDPELTKTIPMPQTLYGVVDSIAHVIERYFSNTPNVAITDRMGEAIMKNLFRYGRLIMNDPKNYDYRAEIMLSCKFAHDDTVGIGRAQDWASHNIEHQLSAVYDVPHGAGLAVIMPAWMRYVYTANIPRFLQFGLNVLGMEIEASTYGGDPGKMALAVIDEFEAALRRLGMPTRMGELCPATEADFQRMAEMAVDTCGGNLGQFKSLDKADIVKIFRLSV